MTYPQAVAYLESLVNFEKKPAWPYQTSLSMERIKGFLGAIGSPQQDLRCLHVAGSKGKGSTCAFLTYILRDAGFKVGLYTSPHLSDFRERLRVLGPGKAQKKQDFEGLIRKQELARLVTELKPEIENYNKASGCGQITFFEACTALAFRYFKEEKVDFAVLETGLGGRLDATNAVYPLACAITPISYEHTDKLGRTLAEIAREKAGIIKGACPSSLLPAGRQGVFRPSLVISAPQKKEAEQVIRQRCKETGAKLYAVGRDIACRKTKSGFNIKGIYAEYKGLKTRLLGEHQLVNACLAVGIIEALRFYGIRVGIGALRCGLSDTVWPGRCEVIAKNPLVVLDGAQNAASARALKKTVKENFRYKKLVLVLGASSDKDIKGISKELYPLADRVILTQADSPRAFDAKTLAKYFKGKLTHITTCVKEAKKLALRLACPEDLILVTGSLFVVGDYRNV